MPRGHYRSRRGVGNIIAGIIVIFLLLFTISQVYVYSFVQLDEYNTIHERMFLSDLDRTNEKLAITNLNVASDTITQITVSNSGTLTAHIVALWVVIAASHTSRTLDVFAPAAGSVAISMSPAISATQKVTLRVVSDRGNLATVSLLPASDDSAILATQLTLVPPNPVTGNTVIVNFVVANNLASGEAVYNLKPSIEIRLQSGSECTSGTPVACTLVSGPTPSSFNLLPSGSTVTFQWIYLVTSTLPDSTATFTVAYETPFIGALVSQKASATATVRQVGGAAAGVGSLSSILGKLTIDATSVQFTKGGTPICWKTGFKLKGSDRTIFRVRVSNIGNSTITLNEKSQFVTTEGGTTKSFYLALGALQPGMTLVAQTVSSNSYVIAPGQTKAVFFGASSATLSPPTTTTAETLPGADKQLFTFFVLLGTQTGSPSDFGQSIPFVAYETTNSDPAGCFMGSFP